MQCDTPSHLLCVLWVMMGTGWRMILQNILSARSPSSPTACCGTVGHLCVAQSLKDADATAVMPFDFGRLIWAGLIGFLFFAEIPGISTLIGAVVIFSAAMYVAIQKSRRR